MVTNRQILEVTDRIVQHFKPHQVILFGSRAYGRPHKDSDVDLLVIMPCRGRNLELTVDILMKAEPPFPIDLLVYRPAEAARRYREFDPVIRWAFDDGKVLYDWHGRAMGSEGRRRFRVGDRAPGCEKARSTIRFAYAHSSAPKSSSKPRLFVEEWHRRTRMIWSN
jgi:predicted nucleotidyltransferase